MQNYQFL